MKSLLTFAFLALVLALGSSQSFAGQFMSYQCVLTTATEVRIRFDLTPTAMKLYDQYRTDGKGKVLHGYAILDNRGLMGGNGKMKDRYVFAVNYRKSTVVSETTSHFYVDPALLQGGKPLRNGSRGGFVSFEGQGYSYESFVCFRAK